MVGLGGLGHMAVKIAHALGAEVTVLSHSLAKKDDGLRMGASHYYATTDPDTFARPNRFELLVNTVSAVVDLDAYLRLLALDGTMVNVGAPAQPLPIQVFTLFGNRRSFAGSGIGGIREIQEMLDFCAAHRIAPEVEVIPAQGINQALGAGAGLRRPLPLRPGLAAEPAALDRPHPRDQAPRTT